MDKQDYLNNLKSHNLRPDKIKIKERKEIILIEQEAKGIAAGVKESLHELFVQQGEIEAMPKGARRDMAILRIGIIAELDAANFYERLAELASNKTITETMMDVANEEKVHAGEFQTLLEEVDPDYEKMEEEGEREVEGEK
jgi:hypothetical protein